MVAAERSFSRAAKKLRRTQPAVSQAIRRLEEHTGERLIDRSSRDGTLTDAGGTNFSGTFTRADNSAGNYVKFTISGSAFTITATPRTGGNATLRAPINGLQIVPRLSQP